MKLRTRLNLVLTGAHPRYSWPSSIAHEIRDARSSVREEIEAANRVAGQLLGNLALTYSSTGGTAAVLEILPHLGHVRANDVTLRMGHGRVLYHSPPPAYKAGREAPAWFVRPAAAAARAADVHLCGDGAAGRAGGPALARHPGCLGRPHAACSDRRRSRWCCSTALAFWLGRPGARALPGHRRRAWSASSAASWPSACRRCAARRRAPSAPPSTAWRRRSRTRCTPSARRARRARTSRTGGSSRCSIEQSLEEERRLIAHELHDEFGQSVTAIRSLAMAIATQSAEANSATAARLISDEAARLYDAMHGLIPRLAPLALDNVGLAASLESLVRDWQRRHPGAAVDAAPRAACGPRHRA